MAYKILLCSKTVKRQIGDISIAGVDERGEESAPVAGFRGVCRGIARAA